MRYLVVAAHPDDEVLGCGGTIARLTGEKHDVYVAILGEGITSRYDQREQADQGIIKKLHARSRQVSKLLGVKELCLYDFPDNRFDTVPLLDIIKTVEKLINRLQPKIVYTHHSGDLNIDHVLTCRATLTACRPLKDSPVKEIYAFEIPSATDWSFQCFNSSFRPNTYKNISDTIDLKISALNCYKSEACDFPHPRSIEAVRANALRWGSLVGVNYAEAFELLFSRS